MATARETAYREELTRLTPGLRQFARALLHDNNAEAADDLVQATLVRALASDQRRSGERLVIWLMSILTTLHRAQVVEVSADHQVSAEARTGKSGGRRQVWDKARSPSQPQTALLGALPLECREVLLLVSLVRLTYAQVAETLGVSINTVVGRLARGREHLGRTDFADSFVPHPQASATRRPAAPYLRVVK